VTQFIEDPERGIFNLARHLNNWAEGLRRHPHFIHGYEDLQSDTEGHTIEALRFLGCRINIVARLGAVHASQLEAMYKPGKAEGMPDHDCDRNDDESLHVRKEKTESFGECLTPEHSALIESILFRQLSQDAKWAVLKMRFDFCGWKPSANFATGHD
jgi:hypothetical protein